MALRIGSSPIPMVAQRHLQSSQNDLQHSLNALASGSRIVSASDDAAGFSIAESLRAQIGSTDQARMNAENAAGLVQIAEGGLNEQTNILVRLRELAVQAASDTVGEKERGFLNTEFQQLSQEFDRIAKTTQYGNQKLLSGSGKDFEFQVGASSGSDDIVKFSMNADTTAGSIGIDGLDVEGKSSARSALNDLDEAMTQIAGVRSTFGAMQSRFEHASNALSVHAENLTAARSRIADTDVAAETSKLARAQIMQAAGASVLAQANSNSMQVLKLIS